LDSFSESYTETLNETLVVSNRFSSWFTQEQLSIVREPSILGFRHDRGGRVGWTMVITTRETKHRGCYAASLPLKL